MELKVLFSLKITTLYQKLKENNSSVLTKMLLYLAEVCLINYVFNFTIESNFYLLI